ncbi:MAG: orotidine 5'-phosphate decarboxylase / HUMPS family protein, partial [Thermoplasmata archaeon]
MERRNGVILALDVTSREEAIQVAEAVRDHVDAIKINWPLILGAGPDIITEMARLRPV